MLHHRSLSRCLLGLYLAGYEKLLGSDHTKTFSVPRLSVNWRQSGKGQREVHTAGRSTRIEHTRLECTYQKSNNGFHSAHRYSGKFFNSTSSSTYVLPFGRTLDGWHACDNKLGDLEERRYRCKTTPFRFIRLYMYLGIHGSL